MKGSKITSLSNGRSTVAAVVRAFEILFAFRPGEKSISLALIATRTGMYKSTILRLLRTMESSGVVSRRIGPAEIQRSEQLPCR
ncbi:MAG: helix-turn-helix domain-containing protein, partial [Paraburkholderia sp.]|nr:helix-turn-helix domain-containing protein [Paraburkholderia sp.]